MHNPDTGLAALQRDGLSLGAEHPLVYPLRQDDKPRAVWPAGLTHLPLVLDGDCEPDREEDERAAEDDRCEHLSLGVRAHNAAMGRL